ncbi:MAG: hypothetical protein FWF97_00510 [Alphaproteobacteria bacterium]|nr:hypothetical protein [Alphaproteobacteria bacterium]
MIDFSKTIEEIKGRIALSCPEGLDARALIFAADKAARARVRSVSCSPESVNMLWTWLEKAGIKIFARVYARDTDAQKIAAGLHGAFKKGAAGAQLIVHPGMLDKLATSLAPVAADLFFGRDLILTVDLIDVQPCDWEGIFHNMKMLDAAGLGVLVSKGENAAGAIYGMLDSFDPGFSGALQIISKDSDLQAIEDTWRLMQKICPDILKDVMFFLPEEM